MALRVKPETGEFNSQRMALIGERDGGNERNFILRASTGGSAATLAAQVGIVDVDLAFENIPRLALCHRAHQLVVDQPGRRVAHPSCRMSASADSPSWLG
jgi:hypothetical protein